MPKKIVLAYSGGLDTSVILKWLQNKYNCPHRIPYPLENVPNYFEGYYDHKKGIRRFRDLKCYIPKLTMFEQDLSDGVNMEKLSSVKSRKKKNK